MNKSLTGNEIREIREALGVNQRDFASTLGITAPYLSDVERGIKNPSQQLINLILSHAVGQRTDIALRDIAAARNQQSSAYSVPADLHAGIVGVIHDVRYVMLSGKPGIVAALVKNVHEFRQAVDTDNELQECKIKMAEMQTQIDALNKKVDRLTAPPTIAKRSEDSSAN